MNIGNMMGSMLGSRGGSMLGGAIGGRNGRMIGSMVGAMIASGGLSKLTSGLGGILGGGDDAPAAPATTISEEDGLVLVEAMITAAKSDGKIDREEESAITERMVDLDPAEQDWLRAQMSSPFDAEGFISSVPADLAQDVYAASLLAIDVDTAEEVAYLKQLASGLDLSDRDVASINEMLGIK